MTIVGIDPGMKQSAVVAWQSIEGTYVRAEIMPNEKVLAYLDSSDTLNRHVVIEQIVATYTSREGAYVGTSLLDTCVWIGRFIECWERQAVPGEWTLVPRKTIVTYLCGNARANDRDVRAAIIDRYGGDPKTAIGMKKQPGPLYWIKNDMWQAAALVEYFRDMQGRTVTDAAPLAQGETP